MLFRSRREWGMLCYVINEKKTYQLEYGYYNNTISDNSNWKEFRDSSTKWLDSVVSVNTTEPATASNGDRYLVGINSTDSFSGVNWTTNFTASFVSQYISDGVTTFWEYTYPKDGMSIRIDNEENSIYRYDGTYETGGYWKKEKTNQVRYIYATTLNNSDYVANSNPIFNSYDTDSIYIVKFASVNIGTSSTLNVNGLGAKTIKKINGANLSNLVTNDIITNYQYFLTYDGTYFELFDSSDSGLNIKYNILAGESVIVPANTQYWVYGDLNIDGYFENNGYAVVVNGSLTASGTFSNLGTYSNIYFAEINGLGVNNYVAHWISPYMLTSTSSIYDDNYLVDITSVTFSINSNIVIPLGASSGYVLTSDEFGNARWQPKKYSATMSVANGFTYSIVHNLDTYDIIMNIWDDLGGWGTAGNLLRFETFNKTTTSVDILSTITSDIRIVIMN